MTSDGDVATAQIRRSMLQPLGGSMSRPNKVCVEAVKEN